MILVIFIYLFIINVLIALVTECFIQPGLYAKDDGATIHIFYGYRRTFRVRMNSENGVLLTSQPVFNRDNELLSFSVLLHNWLNFTIIDDTTLLEGDWYYWELIRPVEQFKVNYSSLHNAVISTLQNKVDYLCNISDQSILFRYVTSKQMQLLLLQDLSMKLNDNVFNCLAPRFITICLDKVSYHYCLVHNIFNCVLTPGLGLILNSSKYYNYATWLKSEILYEIFKLNLVHDIFFFDVDILILKNPYQDKQLKQYNDTLVYDIRYQVDKVYNIETKIKLDDFNSHEQFNSGILYLNLKNSLKFNDFFILMFKFKRDILDGKEYEQKYMSISANQSNLIRNVLPYNLYSSTLHICVQETWLLFSDLISFHLCAMSSTRKVI